MRKLNSRKRQHAGSNQQTFDCSVSNTCVLVVPSELNNGAGTSSVVPEGDHSVSSARNQDNCQPPPTKRSVLNAETIVMHDRKRSILCYRVVAVSKRAEKRYPRTGVSKCIMIRSMPYDARRAWMFTHIKHWEPKGRQTDSKATHSRACSCIYFMPKENGNIVKLCNDFSFEPDKVITVLRETSTASELSLIHIWRCRRRG